MPELLHYYNKLDGLKFLAKALNGVAGTRTLEHQVFRSAENAPRNFLEAPRVLIRSNLDGHLSAEEWGFLPRVDATAQENLQQKIKRMQADFRGKAVYLLGQRDAVEKELGVAKTNANRHFASLHFIVHPTVPRERVALFGTVTVYPYQTRPPRVLLQVRKPDSDQNLWRDRKHMQDTTIAIGYRPAFGPAQRENLDVTLDAAFPGKSDEILDALERAIQAIHKRALKANAIKPGEQLEIAFTLAKNDPTIEFYDLLRLPP